MSRDEDPQLVLASLRSEQRELLGEADGLRRFIACMADLMDAEHTGPGILKLFEQMVDNAVSAVDARDGSFLIPDRRTGELVFLIVRGDEPHSELVGRRLPRGEGIAGWVAENRRPVIVNNVAADERFYPGIDRELDYRTQSVLAAPLMGGDRVIGVVEVLNKRNRRLFSVANQALLGLMCRFAGELLSCMVSNVDLGETVSRIGAERGAG
jgi:GAF domain-containing protein